MHTAEYKIHLSSNMALSAPYMAQIRGISGEIFLYTSGVSVINYDYDTEECRSEYEMLSATLPDVYKSVRSYSDETGKMEAVFDLPEYDCFTGTVSDFLYGKDKRLSSTMVSLAPGESVAVVMLVFSFGLSAGTT